MPLAAVLGTIAHSSLTGTLYLGGAKGEWRIAFTEGFVVAFVASNDATPLLDKLVARGLVTNEIAEKVRSSPLASRQSLRSMLSSRGYMTEDAYRVAVTAEVVDGIELLFLEEDLKYRFDDGKANVGSGPWNRDQVSAGLHISVEPLILDGMRRLDEARRASPPAPEPASAPEAARAEPTPEPDAASA